jgi:hypothetical protein
MLDPSPTPPSGERRAVVRYPAGVLVSCRPLALPPNANLAALVQDVGPRGLGLIVRYHFPPGTRLVVDLGDAGGDQPEPILARVVHVHQRPGGKWLHGCELQQGLTERQLQACRAEPEAEAWVSVAVAP